jgi:hypothetical protein
VLLAAATTLVSSEAESADQRVLLGSVSASATKLGPDLVRAFKDAARREVNQLDLAATRERYVVSLTLTKLDTDASPRRARASCQVSALLTHESQGNVVAILSGRATVEDTPSNVRGMQLDAMRAALKSALRRVPEAAK